MKVEELQIKSIYENNLDMKAFARMLESPTQCYKFYWLEAILTLMPEKDELTFEEIIFEMLWEAWFTVTQYHLHLGPTILGKSETLIEHAIHEIEKDPDITFPMTREQFLHLILKNKERIKEDIKGLTLNVPYRLLSSFASDIGGDDPIWNQKKRLIAYFSMLDTHTKLPYVIIDGRGASRKIRINDSWKQVFMDNYSVIKSWIQMKKICYLQDRNPGVPGVVYKLEDENDKQRRLEQVRRLWLTYEKISSNPLVDIYSGKCIESKQLSIDHFIPWSYVANDELWNLVPMDKRNNSSKGNHLPDWNKYFMELVRTQYQLCGSVFENDHLRKSFESCKNHNLFAAWALEDLYSEKITFNQFSSVLEHHMKPIYEAAELQGYEVWKF